jgi:hypothetical protein
MLDSLVRVSRRVGRVTDTDTADAHTPVVADGFLIESNRSTPASRRQSNIDRLSTVRASVYADIFPLLWHSIHTAVRRLQRKDWLRVPVRRLALNPNVSSAFRIGRSANLREMRRTKTLPFTAARLCVLDYDTITHRTTDSRRRQTAPSVFF